MFSPIRRAALNPPVSVWHLSLNVGRFRKAHIALYTQFLSNPSIHAAMVPGNQVRWQRWCRKRQRETERRREKPMKNSCEALWQYIIYSERDLYFVLCNVKGFSAALIAVAVSSVGIKKAQRHQRLVSPAHLNRFYTLKHAYLLAFQYWDEKISMNLWMFVQNWSQGICLTTTLKLP